MGSENIRPNGLKYVKPHREKYLKPGHVPASTWVVVSRLAMGRRDGNHRRQSLVAEIDLQVTSSTEGGLKARECPARNLCYSPFGMTSRADNEGFDQLS
jgi:hypothetical protein